MDVFKQLSTNAATKPIQCVDMHTCGELTRIVVAGYPPLSGTLLEQRTQARSQHDHIRRRLMLEPRGHTDAYGAILRPDTELTGAGADHHAAHIGVLFTTNDGYSLMCGHATIALGRFLLDTHDTTLFPRRNAIPVDETTLTASLTLHAPCGLVNVTVPVTADGQRSDPTRPVSFVNVPSYATAIDVPIPIPPTLRWPELPHPTVPASFSYGGAFFAFIPVTALGFPSLRNPDLDALNRAVRLLRDAVARTPHSTHPDLGGVYCTIIVDDSLGEPADGAIGAETGYCVFGHAQVDRSPTGSAATARVALAHARGQRNPGQKWTYHSLVSNAVGGASAAFTAGIVDVLPPLFSPDANPTTTTGYPVVRVEVSGRASYIGASTFVVEDDDVLGDTGFLLPRLDELLK